MENLKEVLAELGFSSYKIETYISLLKIKTGTIQQIAKISKVPACKLYENLKWLHERGYISLILQKPLTYKANDPKSTLKLELTQREDKLGKIKEEIEKLNFILPSIENDIVEITNSREAFVKKMKESVEKSKKSISYTTKNWSTDSELLRFLKKKSKEGIKIRAIGPMNEKTKEKIKRVRESGVKTKNQNLASTRFSIFDKKLAIIRLRSDDSYNSIWIKSEVLGEILENYFDMLWKIAKK